MSDVAEVKEAIENVAEFAFEHSGQVWGLDEVVAAARRWVRMVSAGKVRKLCREHHARYNDGAPGCEVWMAARQGGAKPKPCQVEDFLLVALGSFATDGQSVDAAVGVEKDS